MDVARTIDESLGDRDADQQLRTNELRKQRIVLRNRRDALHAHAMQEPLARGVSSWSTQPLSPPYLRRAVLTRPRHDAGEGFFMRNLLSPMIKTVLRGIYADHALMEAARERPRLVNHTAAAPDQTGALTGEYRTANGQNLRGGVTISRADVAHLMVAAVDQPATVHQAIGIAY